MAAGLARLAEARLELCPIDHGFCLPEGLEPPYFEWLHWPQARSGIQPSYPAKTSFSAACMRGLQCVPDFCPSATRLAG